MTATIDDTHDPARRSWVESANRPGCDFPIQNLPPGVFVPPGESRPRIGIAIGDAVLDASTWLSGETLNGYFALPSSTRAALRKQWVQALEAGVPARSLFAQADCRLLLPAAVGDYTDFYASIDHATNVGRMFRPDNPLLPNYKHVPIALPRATPRRWLSSGTPVPRASRTGNSVKRKFGPIA